MEIIEFAVPAIPNFSGSGTLLTSILEGPFSSKHLTVEMMVSDEDFIRNQVRTGAVFRFIWRDGNTYQLPVSNLFFYNIEMEDELGLVTNQRVCRLQLDQIGKLENFLLTDG